MLNQQHTDWRASGTQFSHIGGATGTQFSHLGGGDTGTGARDTGATGMTPNLKVLQPNEAGEPAESPSQPTTSIQMKSFLPLADRSHKTIIPV